MVRTVRDWLQRGKLIGRKVAGKGIMIVLAGEKLKEYPGVSRSTLYRWQKEGKLKVYKLGRQPPRISHWLTAKKKRKGKTSRVAKLTRCSG